jgi:aminocarboxymuconate-semialdehyde decarboxylase
MKDYNLANLIGNPTDTSLAFAKLISGGVLERYPGLKFLLAHAGGFLPLYLEQARSGLPCSRLVEIEALQGAK